MPEPNFENPDFNPENKEERKELSPKERKERNAYEKIVDKLKEKFSNKEARIEKDSTFENQGKEYKIESDLDYMVADAQKELELAQEVLEDAREKDEYYLEKAAAKLVDFLENKNSLVQSYAELKAYRPKLAQELENKFAWLSGLYKHAQSNWNDKNSDQDQNNE